MLAFGFARLGVSRLGVESRWGYSQESELRVAWIAFWELWAGKGFAPPCLHLMRLQGQAVNGASGENGATSGATEAS
jgi:hypothetical protein